MITHYHLGSYARNWSTPDIILPAFAAFKKSEFARLSHFPILREWFGNRCVGRAAKSA
jgi:hypothetical protein